jgi:hypothetical protein
MAGPARKDARRNEPHQQWKLRAADYRQLAGGAEATEVRQVLTHLAMVCAEMAKATDPDAAAASRPDERWLHRNDVVREATGQRWRIREAEYRAIADNCQSADGRQTWLTVANRCGELAHYLEHS